MEEQARGASKTIQKNAMKFNKSSSANVVGEI